MISESEENHNFDDYFIFPSIFPLSSQLGFVQYDFKMLSTVTFSRNDLVFMSRKFCRTIFHKLDFPPSLMSPVRLTNSKAAGQVSANESTVFLSPSIGRKGMMMGECRWTDGQLGSITRGDRTGVGREDHKS